MRIRHPRDATVAIDVNGDTVTPDDDGFYDIGESGDWIDDFAAAHGCDVDDLVVDGSSANGCPFCDDYDGDNVAIHAAQAHPDLWDGYQED